MKGTGEVQDAERAQREAKNNQLFLQPQRLVEILLSAICFLD